MNIERITLDSGLNINNQHASDDYEPNTIQNTVKEINPYLDQNNDVMVDVFLEHKSVTCTLEDGKPYLTIDFMEKNGTLPTELSLKKECEALSALANYRQVSHPTHLRAASDADHITIHLNPNCPLDKSNEFLVLSPNGFQITNETKHKLLCAKTAQALPIPVKIGRKKALKILHKFMVVFGLTLEQMILIITLLLDYYRSQTDHLILYFIGTEGSGKSTLQAFLRSLFDPSSSSLRVLNKRDDIINEAHNNAMLCYDNVSLQAFNKRLEDLLCIVSTGGSLSARRLYSSNKEVIMTLKRPVILSGIDDALTSPDVRERVVYISLKQRNEYRSKTEVQAELEALRPELFSVMVNLFCQALKILPSIELESASRMADYEKLGEAVCQALKLDMSFTSIRKKLDRQHTEESLDGVEECRCLIHYLDQRKKEFAGNFSKLLKLLQSVSEFPNQLPKSPRALKTSLKRHEKSLSKIGVSIRFANSRSANGYEVNIAKDSVKK